MLVAPDGGPSMVQSTWDLVNLGRPSGTKQMAGPERWSGEPVGPTTQSTNKPNNTPKVSMYRFHILDGGLMRTNPKWVHHHYSRPGVYSQISGSDLWSSGPPYPTIPVDRICLCRTDLEKSILLPGICIGLSPPGMDYYQDSIITAIIHFLPIS